jgi:hypothetical protein
MSSGTAEKLRGPRGLRPDGARRAGAIRHEFDAIIVSAGSLQDRLSCQFVLFCSDVGVLPCTRPTARPPSFRQIDRLDTLPRNGSVAVMRNALPGDPWLAVST